MFRVPPVWAATETAAIRPMQNSHLAVRRLFVPLRFIMGFIMVLSLLAQCVKISRHIVGVCVRKS